MYKNPKNVYEVEINKVYEIVEEFVSNGIFAGVDSAITNLETIYKTLTYEQQQKLFANFYQLFCLINTEEMEEM